jgi:carbon-monoxide dehydrogenase small subunit
MSTVNLQLTVNGRQVNTDIDSRTLLVQLIRDQLHLTGTHVGCDTAQCGCCTVHLDGQAVKSCSILAVQAQGKQVTTIEGIAQGEELHPVQQAFRECHGLQCGYCTPGMVMSTIHLLQRNPKPTEA